MNGEKLQRIINQSGFPPLVVTDFNVIVHNIINWWDNNYKYIYKNNKEEILKLAIARVFNLGPVVEGLLQKDYRIIVVADKYKTFEGGDFGYWRHYEIANDPRMEKAWEEYNPSKDIRTYKGGRKTKDDFFYYVFDLAANYCRKYLSFYEFEGFEADDIVGSICRNKEVKETPRVKILYTVDRDWNQLVDESSLVLWATSRNPGPRELIQDRIAGDEDIKFYTEKKMGLKITHPSEMILSKVEMGDLGDNLPPGTPREYMDLVNPHPKYSLENISGYREMIQDCLSLEANNNRDHLEQSQKYFKKLNLVDVVR